MPFAKYTRSSQHSPFQTLPIEINPAKIPISIFNGQSLDEARRMSKVQDRNMHSSTMDGRMSRTSRHSKEDGLKTCHGYGNHRGMSTNIISMYEGLNVRKEDISRWSMSEQPRTKHYIRPTGSELVSSKIPSCIGLPTTWTHIHDRFITYLATHAPLDRNGKVPRHEERNERWKTEDIVREVGERFPELGRGIKATMIEKRLGLLDIAGDNDYFKIPYGAYVYEEWGRGI